MQLNLAILFTLTFLFEASTSAANCVDLKHHARGFGFTLKGGKYDKLPNVGIEISYLIESTPYEIGLGLSKGGKSFDNTANDLEKTYLLEIDELKSQQEIYEIYFRVFPVKIFSSFNLRNSLNQKLTKTQSSWKNIVDTNEGSFTVQEKQTELTFSFGNFWKLSNGIRLGIDWLQISTTLIKEGSYGDIQSKYSLTNIEKKFINRLSDHQLDIQDSSIIRTHLHIGYQF